MSKAILKEFHTKVFPWTAEDSSRIWRALEDALNANDELLAIIDGMADEE